MKILMPILRPSENEYEYNLPLYEVKGETILQHVMNPLLKLRDAEFIFVIRKVDVERFHFDDILKLIVPEAVIVITDGETRGSACTCLLAIDYLKDEEPLLITGCNQLLIATDLQKIIDSYTDENLDGGVVYFESIHPRWSYVKLDEHGLVMQAAEKHPISKNATTGQFFFSNSRCYVEAAFDMLRKNASVNGSFYVCPAYNEMILRQMKIGAYKIQSENYFNFNSRKSIESFESLMESQQCIQAGLNI